MPNKAKLYVACTVLAGLAVLEFGIQQWASSNSARFVTYLLLTLFASTLKVRIPGLTGTFSASFLFVLIGIAELSFSETLVLGCAASLLQTVWRTKNHPKAVQVLFNVACWAVSIGVSYPLSHYALMEARTRSLGVLLALSACLFFVIHTSMLATVMALVEGKPVKDVWQQWYAWSFPYYLVGSAIAGLVSAASRSVGWQGSLLVLPMMYLVYLYYRLCVERALPH